MSRSSPAPISVSAEHVRLLDVQLLSDNWYVLRKFTFDLRRHDGSWQRQNREAYDRGNGAALLLFDPQRRTVVLTRQFRLREPRVSPIRCTPSNQGSAPYDRNQGSAPYVAPDRYKVWG